MRVEPGGVPHPDARRALTQSAEARTVNHPTPTLYATTTLSGGLTVDAALQWLASPDGRTFLAFLGSSVLTAISGAIALRSRAVQARIERARIEHEAKRSEEWAAALHELRMVRLRLPSGPVPAQLPAPDPA